MLAMNKQTLFVSILCLLVAAAAAGTISIGTLPFKSEQRVTPFPTVPQAQFALVDGATVSIEYGYAPGFDRLLIDYAGEFPIEARFDVPTGTLFLTGVAPISEYGVALAAVVFVTTSEDGVRRRITWAYGRNTFFVTSTEHFYQFVRTPFAWEQANHTCGGSRYMDRLGGYLATITSEEEMYVLGYKVQFTAWLGANGDPASGSWKWGTGPERGQVFWEGLSMYRGGKTPVSEGDQYENWFRFMPQHGGNNMTLIDSNYHGAAYWSEAANDLGIPGYVCEYGGLESTPGLLTSATTTFAGSVDLIYSCALFTAATECNNHRDLGCSWTGQRCQQTSCSRHLAERQCVSDATCDWNLDGHRGACVTSRCSVYSNEDACVADPQCQWPTGSGAARVCMNARCDLAPSSTACHRIDGCTMHNGVCGLERGVNCNGVDTVYIMDGTAPMAGLFGKHSEGFFGLAQEFIEAQQVLTGTPAGGDVGSAFGQRVGFIQIGGSTPRVTPGGTGSGGRLTGDPMQAHADLRWHQSTFNSRATMRTLTAALNQANSMFDTTSGREKIIVVFVTGEIADSVSAKSAIATMPNVKVIGVALQPTPTSTMHSRLAASSLRVLTDHVLSLTLEKVPDRVIYGLCSATPGTAGALARASVTNVLCSALANPDTCNANRRCAWDPAAIACVNSPCLSRRLSDCSGLCRADGTLCVSRCASFHAEGDCGSNGCQWQGSASTPYCASLPCTAMPTEDSCIASSTCAFNLSNQNGCSLRVCTHDNQVDCVGDTQNGCAWSDRGACFKNLCGGRGASECSRLAQCTWEAGACRVGYCGRYVNERQCMADRDCEWHVDQAPAACGPRECEILNRGTNVQDACASNAACISVTESGVENRCVTKMCAHAATSCDCATLSGCVWRDQQCRDSRFVQCQPTDVVFLVEATRYMNNAFGRHPDGFIGIVEAIREWSRQAPLSATLDSPGFRLAFVGYGASSPLFTVSVGAKGNLTNDLQAWVGANQELDRIESEQAGTYGNNAISQCAINPGLLKAKEIFRADKAANRRKMLIIMGASEITDGSANLERAISELEADGVQIFTNVIRRFSSITPAEHDAAEFLRPIASDPHQLHFTFTTIEEMHRNLLDNFCDPTSNTGRALGIGRNGVLPCSWLKSQAECSMQPSCSWDADASVVCPRANQCPQLNCMALPPALVASGFSCEHCVLRSGAFDCSLQRVNRAPVGLCKVASCALRCESGCAGADSACNWSPGDAQCNMNTCGAVDGCTSNPGCTFVSTGGSATCRRSMCALFRSATSCNAHQVDDSLDGVRNPCQWSDATTPGICFEKACPYLSQSECNSDVRCAWNPLQTGFKCTTRQCVHSTSELCSMDVGCYWNPFAPAGHRCLPRMDDCQVSNYSAWSPCSANCGAGAVQHKARTIVQPPAAIPTAQSCADVAAVACSTPSLSGNCNPGDTNMVEARSCSSGAEWPADCSAYCAQYNEGRNVVGCAMDISCEWMGGACIPKDSSPCVQMANAEECNQASICAWNDHLSFCEEAVKVCRFPTSSACRGAARCNWATGDDANALGAALGAPVQLVNPGQHEIFVFPNLTRVADSTLVNGAMVTIETGYVRGKDLLDLAFPTSVRTLWLPHSGTLRLSGTATVEEYINVLRAVTFRTTSTRTDPRVATYSFGNATIFSASTGHHYRAVSGRGMTYPQAVAACEALSLHGLSGYLATITSEAENNVVATKLAAEGWVSGADVSRGMWQYTTGPEFGNIFWSGLTADQGGHTVGGSFANWRFDQPSVSLTPGNSHPYITLTGAWVSKQADGEDIHGYVCEFGGLRSDRPSNFAVGGVAVLGVGGCVPTLCAWHTARSQCDKDYECQWSGTRCIPGCSQRATSTECAHGPNNCRWDTDIIPPVCDINKCMNLGEAACVAKTQCAWTPATGCAYKSGCAQYMDAEECNGRSECAWSNNACGKRPCNVNRNEQACVANPLCTWNDGLCAYATCKYGNAGDCEADRECTWTQASSSAVSFSPGGGRVRVFAAGTQAPRESVLIDGVTVAIVEGFQQGLDFLAVDHDRVMADGNRFAVRYNSMTGVLTLRVNDRIPVSALEGHRFLVNNVEFFSAATSLNRRVVTYTLGLNTTASTTAGAFLKYYNRAAPTFDEASTFCRSQQFFGLTGRLANITSQTDSLHLIAMGAVGWIGAQAQADGTWAWVAEAGATTRTQFWRGAGSVGVADPPTAFARWAPGEPVQQSTAGDGAFMTPSGMWRAMTAAAGARAGVICQFGGSGVAPPSSVVNGARSIMAHGCHRTPCLGSSQMFCVADPQCVWRSSPPSCVLDSFCSVASSVSSCSARESCFWDFAVGACRTAPSTACSSRATEAACTDDEASGCTWAAHMVPRDPTRGEGACVFRGCRNHPTRDACTADSSCRWNTAAGVGACVERLCGYQTASSCWADAYCVYQNNRCLPSECHTLAESACSGTCRWSPSEALCVHQRCSATSADACMVDSECLFTSGACTMPNCTKPRAECRADPQCFFDGSRPACIVAQCSVNNDEASCSGHRSGSTELCAWVAESSFCRQRTQDEISGGAANGVDSCEREEEPNMWWLWLLLGVVFVLLLLIMWRLYLAYSKGMSFFEPTRNRKSFSPHQQYAQDLFEEAKETAVESNAVAYNRPTLNDL